MKNVISTVPRTLSLSLSVSHGDNTIANVYKNYFASVADAAKQGINYSHKYLSKCLKHQ